MPSRLASLFPAGGEELADHGWQGLLRPTRGAEFLFAGGEASGRNFRPLRGDALWPTSFEAEKEVEEEPASEPFPQDCQVELRPDEPRACEQRWVNWCQDECRAHYGKKKKALYQGPDREDCYNACISHCVLGRDAEGRARPMCPLQNGYSEKYTFPKDGEKVD